MSNDENDDNNDSDINDGKSSGKPMLHMRREPAACVIGTVSEVDWEKNNEWMIEWVNDVWMDGQTLSSTQPSLKWWGEGVQSFWRLLDSKEWVAEQKIEFQKK